MRSHYNISENVGNIVRCQLQKCIQYWISLVQSQFLLRLKFQPTGMILFRNYSTWRHVIKVSNTDLSREYDKLVCPYIHS